MEASGGKACPPAGRRPDRGERRLHEALAARGIAAAIVNPARVRHFAEASGRLAKTDLCGRPTVVK
jgi:transposase